MNAWMVIIKMWKIAQAPPGNPCIHHGMIATKIKMSSPANMLPNKRSANESGLTNSSNKRNSTLIGNKYQPNGFDSTSFAKPSGPFALKL